MRGPGRISSVTLLVLFAGAVVTVAMIGAARTAYEDNEDRLLRQRTQEAAAVLESAIPAVESGLAQVATLADVVVDDDPDAVEAAIGDQMESRFAAMSVWREGSPDPLVTAGEHKLEVDGATLDEWFGDLPGEGESRVRVLDLLDLPDPRIGYVYTSAGAEPLLVYGEQPTPPDRRTQIDRGEAFDSLDFALYLGDVEDEEHLLFASTENLRIEGRRESSEVPFGESVLTLVASPREQLGGHLLARLPFLVGAGGVVSTLVGAALVEGLHRRRRRAEELTARVEELYGREHAIAHTLQHSLLPRSLPEPAGADIAVKYAAGTAGTDVGGDWYDVVDLRNGRLALVVGDVAGKGVKAAAVMAAMRYGTHTIAAQHLAPDAVLAGINRLDGIRGDFVTVVCGVLDVEDRSLTVARAGHPPPLLLHDGGAEYLDGPVGPPVGFMDAAQYEAVSFALPAGATLMLFTDGLYERRDEEIDVGLERLRTVAAAHRGTTQELVDDVCDELVGDRGRDDVAILAVRLHA